MKKILRAGVADIKCYFRKFRFLTLILFFSLLFFSQEKVVAGDYNYVNIDPPCQVSITGDTLLTCIKPTITLRAKTGLLGGTCTWTVSNGGVVSEVLGTVLGGDASLEAKAAGTYTLTVRNSLTGCIAISTIRVSDARANVFLKISGSTLLTCANPRLTLNANINIGGCTYSWVAINGGIIVSGASSSSVIVSSVGTYIVTVNNASTGCVYTERVVVTGTNLNLAVRINGDTVLSCTNPSLTLSANVNVNAGVIYTWTAINGGAIVSGANSANVVVNAAGTYILSVRDPITGCVGVDRINVTNLNANISVKIGGGTQITCTTPKLTLTATANISGGNYLWTCFNGGVIVSGANTANVLVSAAGTYKVTVKDPVSGCIGVSLVTVTNASANLTLRITGNTVLACNTPQTTLTATTNVTGAVYLWRASNGGVIVSGSASASVIVNAAGTYILVLTDTATGCTITEKIIVTNVSANLSVNIEGNTQLSCLNPQLRLNAKLGLNLNGARLNDEVGQGIYLWTAVRGGIIISGANSPSVMVNAAGTYKVSVRNPVTGCSAMDSIIITDVRVNLAVNITGNTQLTCTNREVKLTANVNLTGCTYLWTTVDGGLIISGGNTATVRVGAAGTYRVTIKDLLTGCIGTQVVVVTNVNTNVTVNAGIDKQLTCRVTQITLSGSTNISGGIYLWTASNGGVIVSGATSANVVVNAAGTYTLKVTDPVTGCVGIDVVIVTNVNPVIKVNVAGNVQLTCGMTQIKLSAATNVSGGTYLWTASNGGVIVSGANTLNDVVVSSAGTYTLRVTDRNGCVGVGVVIVTNVNTDVSIDVDTLRVLTCLDTKLTIKATTNITAGICSWVAANGGVIVSGANSLNLVVSAAGTYTITVKDTITGCIGKAIVRVVIVNTDVAVNAGSDMSLTCASTQVTLRGTTNITGGTYLWTASNGGNIISGANTLDNVVVNAAGTYTLKVTDPKTGCYGLDETIVTLVNTDVAVNVGADKILNCTNSTVTLSATTNISNGTYLWTASNGGVIVSGANTLNAVVSAAGSYTLTVRNPLTGCAGSGTVQVTFSNTDVAVNVDANVTLTCLNPVIKLRASTNLISGSYLWTASEGGVIVSGATTLDSVKVSAAGKYTLKVTNPITGCIGLGVVTVTRLNTDISVNVGSDQVIDCAHPTATISATTNLRTGIYLWTASSGGVILSGANSLNAVVSAAGTYTLTITDPLTGCIGIGVVKVTRVNTGVSVNVQGNVTLDCKNPTIKLTATTNITAGVYLWTASNGGVIVSGANTLNNVVVSAAGTYTLTVKDSLTGCTGTGIVMVTYLNTDVSVNIGNAGVITCENPTVTLSATTNVTGGIYLWTASNGGVIVSGANTLNNAVVSAAGTYTLTVTNPLTGCIGIGVVIVTKVNTGVAVNVCQDRSITCINPKVRLTATTNITTGIYLWTATDGGVIVSGANTLDNVIVSAAGKYTLTVTDSLSGCSGTGLVIVTQINTNVVVNVPGPKTITCENPIAFLTASTNITGGTYLWTASNGGIIVSGANTLEAKVSAAGTYTLTITDNKGCVGIGVVVVTMLNTDVSVHVCKDKVISCANPRVTLTASTNVTGGTYLWTASNGGVIVSGANTLEVIVSAAGTYTLTVKNAKGCIGVGVVIVRGSASDISVSAGGDRVISCENPQLTITATSDLSGGIYSWVASEGGVIVSGANSATIVVSAAGKYVVKVKDPNSSCVGYSGVRVRGDLNATVDAGADVSLSCSKSELRLHASTNLTAAIYLWTASNGGVIVSGANSSDVIVKSAGTYSVTVKTANGACTAADIVIVSGSNKDVNVNAGPDKILGCKITQVILSASSNITGLISWTASNGGNILSGANTLSPLVDAIGTYMLTIKDSVSGCIGSDVVLVTGCDLAGVVIAGPDKELNCGALDVTLTATTELSGGEILWTSSEGGNIVSGSTSLVAVVNAPGVYMITIRNPKTGCIGSDVVVVTGTGGFGLKVDAGIDKALTCLLPQVTLTATTNLTGGVYTWTASNGGSIVSGAKTLNLTVKAAGTYTLTVKDIKTGCSISDDVIVTNISTSVTVSAGDSKELTCNDPQLSITAVTNLVNGIYLWEASNGGVIISGANSLNVLVGASGTYKITVKDPVSGCFASDLITVKIKGSQAVCTLKIFPNPAAKGKISVELEGVVNVNQRVNVEIYDLAGKFIYSEKAFYQNNKKLAVINIDEKFIAGTYMVKIKVDGKTYTEKLVIQY